MATIIGIIVLCGSGILGFFGMKKSRESGVLANYVKADSIAAIPNGGPVWAHGIVATQTPLQSPITQKPCVYYRYTIEREVKVQNSNGGYSVQWQAVGASQMQHIPFLLQDASGSVNVVTDGCEVEGISYTEQFLNPGTIFPGGGTQGNETLLSTVASVAGALSGNRERAKEYAIFVGTELNVFGFSGVEGAQKALMKQDSFPLILSTKTKEKLIGSEKRISYLLFVLALVLCAAGVYLLTLK